MELQIGHNMHPKCIVDKQTDEQSGPTTRPAFYQAKAMQVKIIYNTKNNSFFHKLESVMKNISFIVYVKFINESGQVVSDSLVD